MTGSQTGGDSDGGDDASTGLIAVRVGGRPLGTDVGATGEVGPSSTGTMDGLDDSGERSLLVTCRVCLGDASSALTGALVLNQPVTILTIHRQTDRHHRGRRVAPVRFTLAGVSMEPVAHPS